MDTLEHQMKAAEPLRIGAHEGQQVLARLGIRARIVQKQAG